MYGIQSDFYVLRILRIQIGFVCGSRPTRSWLATARPGDAQGALERWHGSVKSRLVDWEMCGQWPRTHGDPPGAETPATRSRQRWGLKTASLVFITIGLSRSGRHGCWVCLTVPSRASAALTLEKIFLWHLKATVRVLSCTTAFRSNSQTLYSSFLAGLSVGVPPSWLRLPIIMIQLTETIKLGLTVTVSKQSMMQRNYSETWKTWKYLEPLGLVPPNSNMSSWNIWILTRINSYKSIVYMNSNMNSYVWIHKVGDVAEHVAAQALVRVRRRGGAPLQRPGSPQL